MKTELINAGFVKIGGDMLRVEAPVKERDKGGKRGRKLRVRVGRDDEPEPNVWHLYQKQTRIEKNKDGGEDEVEFFALVKDSFKGTRDEAVAACISEFGGAT